MESLIQVRDLRMSYGDNDVLTGADFDVQTGEVVCLLGPNGAGKTTTIGILEGFRIRVARERRADYAFLVTSEEDQLAQRLYEAAGFSAGPRDGGPLMLAYERELQSGPRS